VNGDEDEGVGVDVRRGRVRDQRKRDVSTCGFVLPSSMTLRFGSRPQPLSLLPASSLLPALHQGSRTNTGVGRRNEVKRAARVRKMMMKRRRMMKKKNET